MSKKFITSMIYGISTSGLVLLSEIGRTFNEETLLKKIVEILSRNLMNFDQSELLESNYENLIKPLVNQESLFIVDDTDISKPLSNKLECLGQVLDGSDKYKITKGYHVSEIVLFNKNTDPLSVSSRLWSEIEEGFISSNNYLKKDILNNVSKYGKEGCYIYD